MKKLTVMIMTMVVQTNITLLELLYLIKQKIIKQKH